MEFCAVFACFVEFVYENVNLNIKLNFSTAAMDILRLIGFVEDVIVDEWGKAEAFLMLKRNDPGLLWLAKSSLENYIS